MAGQRFGRLNRCSKKNDKICMALFSWTNEIIQQNSDLDRRTPAFAPSSAQEGA